MKQPTFLYHVGILLTIALHLSWYCCSASLKRGKFQEIHRSMKRRDLSRIFGTEIPDDAPPYEIFSPFIRSDESDEIRSQKTRVRRNLPAQSKTHLKVGIPAFGKLYHLNMTQNRDLIAPNFRVEVKRHYNKTFIKRNVRNDCYYHGNVHDDSMSMAAISTCDGLSGMFISDTHHYFIEPVPRYLRNNNAETDFEIPHIVFRRALQKHTGDNMSGMLEKLWKKDAVRVKRTDVDHHKINRRTTDDFGSLSATTLSPSSEDNSERYIEALVVVDQKMVNYHGEDAATQFALVVMNMVARLLRDSSIGANLVILVVLKLQLHTVDVPGLVINHHARNTLESFGNWAQRSSDQDDRSDDHFDYAILLTRYNICADDNQPCDNMGLAETGGMCLWPYSASVNEDNGLGLVYTVTHSIGHSLGMNHDGDESSFICPDNEFIMASTVSGDWKEDRNHWSRCSRNYLRQFLKKEQASCLLDLPVQLRAVDYEVMGSRPGVLYDISKQCEMQFGTGSKLCNKNIEGICQILSCTNPLKAGKCFKSVYPAVDGTNCAANKYCYHGKCISSSKEMDAVDGGWSSWNENYQLCSRSCGGGVQYRTRQCIHPRPSNGGKYCEGEPRSFKLCNTQPCNNTTPGSHRTMQCSNLNNRLFGERKFEWEFKPSKIGSCKLGCFISQTGHGYDFGNVDDGTNCDQMDDDVYTDKCINGLCTPVGCDKTLNSNAKYDRCGVCNGDGLSCVTGSERSKISEATASAGGIADALKSLKEMGFDMAHLYGKSSLDLGGGVSGKRSDISKKDEFGWARIKSGCSASCGGGIEKVTAECRRQDDGSPVRQDHCDKRTKPPTQQYPCKEEQCPPIWQTSYWGDCSKTCNGGFKRRNVRCVQKSSTGIEYDLDGVLCGSVRPSDTEGCNKEPCPAEWIAQPFGECSTICGPGVQSRELLCQKTIKDGSLVTLHDDECRKETKPPSEQRCNVHNPCPGDAGCGGIYTDKRGNFTSPGYPDKYPNNMECVHIIQVPPENVIQLSFDKMKIAAADKECKNDLVKVMDGDCVSRLGESKFCGKTTPSPFISTTNRLCVKFYSDDSINDEGFVARYSAIDKPSQTTDICGSNLTAPDGLISSPNYPEFYPQNEDCNYTITTEETPIRIKFHAFDVGSDDCDNDYVTLSGGDESKRFCGQKIPSDYVSKDNVLHVRFVSSNKQTTMKPGFVATYTTGLSESARSGIPKMISRPMMNKTGSYLTANNAIVETTKKAINPAVIHGVKNDTKLPPVSNNTTQQNESTVNSPAAVSFVKSQRPDEIAKDLLNVKQESNNNIHAIKTPELSTAQKAFINALKDDTPAWIPEPANPQDALIDSDTNARSTINNQTINVRNGRTNNGTTIRNGTTSNQVTSSNNNTSNTNTTIIPVSKLHNATLSKHANTTTTSITTTSLSNKIYKKSFITKPVSYKHNLDGVTGSCPQSLRCIDLLMQSPCDMYGRCPRGLSCCVTSCGMLGAQRMCLPKVTDNCPLKLPYQVSYMPCKAQYDCPIRSTCCRDMANHKYCRFVNED